MSASAPPLTLAAPEPWHQHLRFEWLAPLLAVAFLGKNPTSEPDYGAYMAIYAANTLRTLFAASDVEWGFRALCALGNVFGLSYAAFGYFVVTGTVAAKFYAFRRLLGSASSLAVLFYLSSLFILHELVQIRLAVALAFVALAAVQWMARRRVLALLFVAAAVSMHLSLVLLVVALGLGRYPRVVLAGAIGLATLGLMPEENRTAMIAAVVQFLGTRTPLFQKVAEYAFQLGQVPPGSVLVSAQTLVVAGTAAGVAVAHRVAADDDRRTAMAGAISVLLVSGLIARVVLASSPVVSGRLLELFATVMPAGQALTVVWISRRWPGAGMPIVAGFLTLNLWAFAHVLVPLRDFLWP